MGNPQREFSALDYVKELRDAGVSQEQAEVQARHLELVKADIESNLATKRDIESVRKEIESVRKEIESVRKEIEMVRSELKKDIESVRSELKQDIAELNATLTFRMCCIVGVGVGLLGGLITALKFLF